MPEAQEAVVAEDALWDAVAERIASQMGMHFPPSRRRELRRGLAAAAGELGLQDDGDLARRLLGSDAPFERAQVQALARHLSVGETYFFRDPGLFDVLRMRVLPQLVRARSGVRRLRIWSAGCCTGEEPYSIAMLLAQALPDFEQWNVSILATDIEPRFLAAAERGEYGAWSFRSTPEAVRSAFFTQGAKGRWQIAPRIRSLVRFAYLNLAQDAYPSIANGTNAMDLVFCRNVLMYFEPQRSRSVLASLGQSLRDDGWLFVNPVEIPHAAVMQLVSVPMPGAIGLRRRATAAAVPEATGVVAPPAVIVTGPLVPEPAGTRGATVVPAQARAERGRERPNDDSRPPDPRLRGDDNELLLRAREAADRGELEAALQWCRRSIEADKVDAHAHYLLASILQELGRHAESAAALRRTLYLEPDHVLAHVALGNIARRDGHAREAERHFRNALDKVAACPPEAVLGEFEGMPAGRLAETIRASLAQRRRA
jgi:chemotaxis protein methyltransferase CheR